MKLCKAWNRQWIEGCWGRLGGLGLLSTSVPQWAWAQEGGVRTSPGTPFLTDAAASAPVPDEASFQALSTPLSPESPVPGGEQLLALLRHTDWGIGLIDALDRSPVVSGLLLGLLLGAGAVWAWRWSVQSRAWREELAALKAEGIDLGAHPTKAAVRQAQSWRLSRLEELPREWPETMVMPREEVYDLEEEWAASQERSRFFGRRRRQAANGWAVTVIPRE